MGCYIIEHPHDSIRFTETLVCEIICGCFFKIVKCKHLLRQMIQVPLRKDFISTVKICILHDDLAVEMIGSILNFHIENVAGQGEF